MNTDTDVYVLECTDDHGDSGPCHGEVHEHRSRSGATVTARCVAHQDAYERRMDAVYAGVDDRYPGWDNPGSSPPEWFDPANAGESWDED